MTRPKSVGVFEIWWSAKVEILAATPADMTIGILELGSIDFDPSRSALEALVIKTKERSSCYFGILYKH